MKKILYIYHTSAIGGGSYCLLNILKEIDRTLYTPSVMLSSDGPLVDEIRKMDIDVYIFPFIYSVPYNSNLFRPKRLLNMAKMVLKYPSYRKLVKDINPDIIYVNSMMLYPYLIVKKKQGCKSIVHIREHWPANEHKLQRALAERVMNKYADCIIAINHFSACMFKSLTASTKVVYDWIDLDGRNQRFDMQTVFGEDVSDKKVFLFTGGYNPIKGTKEVIESFINIKDSKVRLLMLGVPVPEQYNGIRKLKKILLNLQHKTSYMEKVIELINSDQRIKCIPVTYNIKQILEQSSCMLSFFTIPHANLAMAESIIAGTPVIAADTEESREYANHGQAALLYEFGNIEAFKDSIKYYLEHSSEVDDKCKKNQNKLQQVFDRKRNANVLNSIYANI